MEADLLASPLAVAGIRLREVPSDRFDWHDLKVFTKYLGPHSHLVAELFPERAGWDLRNQLLASIADDARWLHWSKTGSAQAGDPPPKRIPRPGVVEDKVRPGSKTKPMTMEKGKEVFDRPDPERESKLHAMFRGG